jgi:hypothetical protein
MILEVVKMIEYVGKRMNLDTSSVDGSVYFEKDLMIWKSKDLKYTVEIKYSDIKNIRVFNDDIKKRVEICTEDEKTYYFYLYRSGTFLELVKAGITACEEIKEKGIAQISDADLERLSKLSSLRKDGVLTEEEFEIQKSEIMKKYK